MKINELLEAEIKLPKRASKTGVGKLIGGQLYVHEQYANEVAPIMGMKDWLRRAIDIASDWDFEVVKFDPKVNKISLLQSPDWNTSPEPQVTAAIIVDQEQNTKRWNAPTSGVIYHHKWLFVKDDYKGFDVEESKDRSRHWMKVMDENPDLSYSKIGSKAYWEAQVLPKL